MPRMYSGPLQQGKRSAKVPGVYTKRNMLRRTRPKTLPSRLYSGKKTYTRTTAIAQNVMKSISESKYQGAREDCLKTVAKPGGTIRPMSYTFVNTGEDLSANLPEFQTPLNLFKFPQGTESTERIGKYMYIKKSHLKINVMALPQKSDGRPDDVLINTPLECRMFVVKANRKNDKIFKSPNPGNSLLIDTQNGSFGYDETLGSINLLQKQPINRRQWLKYRDYKFTLSPPAVNLVDGVQAYQTGKQYPVQRNFTFDLPIYKKTHFSESTEAPDDVDTQWLIILQVSYLNHCLNEGSTALRPDNVRMEILGTTSAYDN